MASGKSYCSDVFLNHAYDSHRFTTDLFNALSDAGIMARKDSYGLHSFGVADIFPYNYRLLNRTKIFIPVFSKGYAFSATSLVDLALMAKCSLTGNQTAVLPIFYNVRPHEFRGQNGTAFSRHVGKYKHEIVQQWKDALEEFGAFKGWELKSTDGDEAGIIRLVVSRVVKEVKELKGSYVGTESLVGIDDRIGTVMGLLDLDANDVRMVGIYGMGGIGKTTLANVIYNNISHRFGGCCFLKAVRYTMESRPDGPKHLQSLLVTNIFNNNHPFSRGSDLKNLLKHHDLRNKKILIVLDDVDNTKQVDELAGGYLDWFGLGSRIIVTTRNKDILSKVEQAFQYEVKELDQHDAFLLFCKQAFQQDSPPDRYVAISNKIVQATGGLPLAVEAIGSYLFSEKGNVWEDALGRLKAEPGIREKLMISYNALNDKQKRMFLDVACFFIGLDVRIAAHMWRECNCFSEAGLELLSLMSVIKIGDDNKLWVHDQFRELGKEIVRQENLDQPGQRSRLWGKEALDFLDEQERRKWFSWSKGRGKIGVTSKVEAIHLDYEESKQFTISIEKFAGLKKLWYLDLANANLEGDFRGNVSSLRWLGWHCCQSELNVPASLYVTNLVVLDLSKSTISEKWTGWSSIKEAKKLEVLNLTSCHHLTRTPDFSSFVCMKRLMLRDCILLDLIDTSIGGLKSLSYLDIRNCPSLKRIPNDLGSLAELTELLIDESSIEEIPWLGGMKNLEIFSAKSCKSLRRIPMSIASLAKLQKVLLDNCKSLTAIPCTVWQLESLKELSLSYTRVMELPDSIEEWSNLEVLNIDHCPIRNFPCSVRNLRKLEVINASGCLNLKGIPLELECLSSLKVLRLDHTSVSSIPASITGLPHLQTLDLEGCTNLQTLPKLPASLINLKVDLTSSVIVLNLPDLINLKHLEFQRCKRSYVPRNPRKVKIPSSPQYLIQPEYEYEVFLSFRGLDTRDAFADILYKLLTEVGIRTFIDNEALQVGEEIGPELLRAINQSKISIPIFSKDYASSKWCLMEAAKIVECMDAGKQKVFPIFFYVAPDEVRHQTGIYAESFSEHVSSNKYDLSIIQQWRESLKKIGARKGWHLKSSANCSHGTVLKEVVSKILKKLKKPNLDVTENLVGIEDHMEAVMRLLDSDVDDVRMLGIWGMGGVGKTTVAKFIFNELASQFEYQSFLENIKGASRESKMLESLQTKLACDTLRHKYDKFENVDEGKSVLGSRLRNKKLLVLVDDVDQAEQLDCLVGGLDWFGPGSKIIVTTREADVLYKSKVPWSCYEVKEMRPHDAFLLFCKHAFRQDSPLPEFANLSWDIIEATGGLPLAVRAIGSSLSFTKDKYVWEEAKNSLKTKREIQDKLRVSYDALNTEQQEIFLDVACIFKGADKRIAFHMWKTRKFSPESTVQELFLRSLIKVERDNTLWMHDLFVELGRQIVRQESHNKLGEQSRLWCSKDVIEVLEGKKGTKEVRAIHLDCGSVSEKCRFSHENFEMLTNLEILGLGDANLHGNFEGRMSNLKWLSWHGHNLLDVPSSLHTRNLVVADLSKSEIRDDWEGWSSIQEAETLEVLDLTSCHQLIKTPDFSMFSRMKRLIVEDCQQLVAVDKSISHLSTLEYFSARNCLKLQKLPEEMGLVALVELLLDRSAIQTLPISGDMKNLKIVSAKSCKSLTSIPVDIGELESLKELYLSRTSVVYLPQSVSHLSNLEVLEIDHCLIGELPQSLMKLRKLEVIDASGCRNLKGDIPTELGDLSFLKVLRLGQTCITSIPESIAKLSALHTLDLKDCLKIETLPNLPSSLVDLKVTLTSSVIVPNLPDLVNLKRLEILHCGELNQVLTDIDKFSDIEKLSITKKAHQKTRVA